MSQTSRPGKLPIDLALQGGGSHGAFTWGVLDRLLEDETLEIAAISGTSAGAMNAVALASGLMDGGREGAQRVLRQFWTRVAELSPFHRLQTSPMGVLMGPATDWLAPWLKPWTEPLQQAADAFGHTLSPYQLNPLNLNPLRDILVDTIDFDRARRCHKTQLFIAATQVRTGALRVFAQHELTADMVLASACLPLLFQAVDIEGEAYWDGGYAGNPTLLPLVNEACADDLLLVQINPTQRESVPTTARDILDRINEVTFNASLVKELRTLALLKQVIGEQRSPHSPALFQRVQRLRVHLIEGGESLAALGAGSKTNTQWAFLSNLHAMGREAADRWLHAHRKDLGQRSTLDLGPVMIDD
ncbi:MAG: patatin-like phospholipase family protein [Hydrogenophaga sp.]|jgi:NTE family protein|uniref:patatin-like phospholipase family protein n=1 Tax=Hydrogenophaga sp. TaxID=1904254 RepID=UPI0026270BA0|nr:patatin-like phospholipase family protein [Hydrogenophaga sp.]MCW5669022.1 patatin-like phospholipase family protein [Hydrogenophaga sp.]